MRDAALMRGAMVNPLGQSGLWGDVRITEESLKGTRVSADRVEWSVPVPANGTSSLTATFDSRAGRSAWADCPLPSVAWRARRRAATGRVGRARGGFAYGLSLWSSGNPPIQTWWPAGYALVTETRTVTIPAGETLIRFQAVADGMYPESAIVTGLPKGVKEKNRDARLLSPFGLVDA